MKTTLPLLDELKKAFAALFQAGACLRHQPHPSEAIHLTNTVLPWSISDWIFDA